ncbi:septum site-determining protein Ssd [Nocardia sp. CDC160]|uniref:septum site-determining protein Ssd n=1 Tax=Nocardia sp. CDC160 TaxID=3112166 RepID=UPI002DBB2681|nr:septum site-determining protein Ssd [Nocardia sp. CDC160]MEC3913815.1 septum site-determining protein Ssd [Nocardia sp. CDC160]
MNSEAATPPALSLVADPRLRDEIRRIAAAADRPLDERVPPPGRHAWGAASVIILDTAAALSCTSAEHPRRAGILLVTDGEPGLLDWQAATAAGAEAVLALPTAADALIAAFAAHDGRRPGDGAVLAVAGAGAGSGASVLAAAVALTAAGRFRDRTLLVDCAPYGGGLDLLLGLEKAPGLRWPDLTIERGRVSASTLHAALPVVSGLAVLSCGRGTPAHDSGVTVGRALEIDSPGTEEDSGAEVVGLIERDTADPARDPDITAASLSPAAVRAVIEGGRAAGDLVVADLSSDHGPYTDQALDSADLVVLVTQARLRSVAAAESAAAYLGARNPNVRVIVRGPSPGGLAATDIAAALGIPLLATVPSQPGLAERLERGGLTVRRRGPLRTAAETALTALFADYSEPRRNPVRPEAAWWRIARSHHAAVHRTARVQVRDE